MIVGRFASPPRPTPSQRQQTRPSEKCSNLPLHQLIESFTLRSSESDDADEPHVRSQVESEDERWWAEVDRAIATDSIADDFFAHSPAVIDLDPPALSGACPCGRLPHLCTCEYYRRLRQQELQLQLPGGLQLEVGDVASTSEMQQPVKRRRITGKQSMQSS